VSYCRRARTKPKIRTKPCQQCRFSKTRCSFKEPSCERCTARNLACVYEPPRKGAEAELTFDIMRQTPSNHPMTTTQHTGGHSTDLAMTEGIDLPSILMDDNVPGGDSIAADEMALILGYDQNQQIWNYDTDSFAEFDPTHLSSRPEALLTSQRNPYKASRAKIIRTSTPSWVPSILRSLSLPDPATQQSINLAMNIIRSFPQMMLRRQTFPPFIHPLWHLPTLPESLASCMSIAQLFVSRTSESRPFLWRCIRAEELRMRDEVVTFTRFDFQYAVQALQIYLIMVMMDQDEGSTKRGAHVMETCRVCSAFLCFGMGQYLMCSSLQILSENFQSRGFNCSQSESEIARPTSSWEEWIFAENQRR
jgi:hypothetical protein